MGRKGVYKPKEKSVTEKHGYNAFATEGIKGKKSLWKVTVWLNFHGSRIITISCKGKLCTVANS